mmetsp:Transcript_30717/g.22800  ORF Transcript_30717/g.22800 Transcript_30717/m.22800 type:complete len:120 (+) Transcript_30717:945-1304(+)
MELKEELKDVSSKIDKEKLGIFKVQSPERVGGKDGSFFWVFQRNYLKARESSVDNRKEIKVLKRPYVPPRHNKAKINQSVDMYQRSPSQKDRNVARNYAGGQRFNNAQSVNVSTKNLKS